MDLSNKSILICDDSILARKSLKDAINSYASGATFYEATNGEQSVSLYKEHHPDMVLLDIVMPLKDGISATKEIIKENADATIIIVSSVGTQLQLKKAIEAGAKDFIQKPINQAQIDRLINIHLGGES
ncbi:MAG: response regulator [Lachnospiraceae bacterium]|nr:response regulator [Pseudobutyrivibrio sp.]MEE0107054.1 response regulator [Lachnospiraceae bacterium]